jgi:Ca2+-binding RTX toxin-like protein
MANATSTQLQELYVAYFGRAADPTGLDYWTEKGITTAKFAADMYVQAEFKDAYGSLSTEAQVNQIYKNLFDREADVTGLTYWTQQINLGNLKLAEIANHLIYAAQNNSGSEDDKTALTNKTNAAVAYTAKVKETTAGILAYAAESTSPWVSGDNITEAVTYLSAINKDTAHTAAGVANSVTTITTNGAPTSSLSFTLTTKADNFTGGDGADVFTATSGSFALTDVLKGGAGVDRLNYLDDTDSGTSDIPVAATTGIEKWYIRHLETANSAEKYDFGAVTGETEVWNDRSLDDVDFDNLGTSTTVGVLGDGTTVVGATNFNFATATDAVTLALKGGVGASGTAPAITNTAGTNTAVTITSTGAANTFGTVDLATATITSATVTATTNLKGDFFSEATEQIGTSGSITISGEATSVNFTAALDDAIKTIDASGLTSGGLTATLGTLATQSFTGGGGADVITTGVAPTAGTIAAGAGSDTLILGGTTHLDTAAEAARFTGFETLRTVGSFNLNLLDSLTALQVSTTTAAATFSNMDATQAANVDIIGTINTNGATFALETTSGTSDVFTADIGDDTSTAGVGLDVDTLTLNGFETINLRAVHGSSAAVGSAQRSTIEKITSDVATAVNLTGSSVDLANVAMTKAATIDASALTGDNTVAGAHGLIAGGSAVAASTIKGSAYIDTVTIGATGSTYTLNGGADVVTATQAILAGSVSVDGGAGNDNLKLNDADTITTGTFTITDANFANVASFETITVVNGQAGDTIWALGGYANAMATAAGGTLTAVMNSVDTGVTTDIITINASSLGGTNALDLTLTNNATTAAANAGTDTYTGGDGNDTFTINYNANHSNETSVVTITAGAGDDTITFTMGTGTSVPGALILIGGAGNDTITGSAESETITGGAGVDTMTGGGSADIFVLSTVTDSNAATAGAIDKITDFVGGSDSIKSGTAGGTLRSVTLTVGYTSCDTISELNTLLNSTNGTASTAKFDSIGGDLAKITTNDARVLLAQDVDTSGTFTAADIVVEITGLTGSLVSGDVDA